MVTLQTIEDALPSCAASHSLLRALYGWNEWLMKPMLDFLQPPMRQEYGAGVERIWQILPAIRPIDETQRLDEADHIYLFRGLEEVRALLQDWGLKVQDELDLPLKMNLPLCKPAYQVAIVCRPAA